MTKKSALVIGGTGQIGQAITQTLLVKGWDVTVTYRGNNPLAQALADAGARLIIYDRNKSPSLREIMGSGADVVVDTIAYDTVHADQLLEIQKDIGLFIVISSSSVYCDGEGRSLDEGRINGFPDLPKAMKEEQATLPPGNENYSTKKVALECRIFEKSASPVTVLRPCAIHGVASAHPREWWFVKRMLDARKLIPLAYRGESRFHTTSVFNIAGLVGVVVEKPATQILNIGDERCLSVAEIGKTIGKHLHFRGNLALIDDNRYPPIMGETPWSVPDPFMIDSSAARKLGFVPLSYEETIGPVCDWLVGFTADGKWKERFPIFDEYAENPFDYERENEYLSMRRGFRIEPIIAS